MKMAFKLKPQHYSKTSNVKKSRKTCLLMHGGRMISQMISNVEQVTLVSVCGLCGWSGIWWCWKGHRSAKHSSTYHSTVPFRNPWAASKQQTCYFPSNSSRFFDASDVLTTSPSSLILWFLYFLTYFLSSSCYSGVSWPFDCEPGPCCSHDFKS